jgi:hypothetical protein
VVLEITAHREIAIQNISVFPVGFEVLLPRYQRVIIDTIALLEDTPRTFLIKMQGVESISFDAQINLFFARVA